MVNELKPCPFCGSEATPVKLEYGDGAVYYGITCVSYDCPCSTTIPNFRNANDAIESWNKRVNRRQECLIDDLIDDGR